MKLIAVIKKEYREIVKKKSFIISTILTPLIMAAFMFLPVLLMKMGKGEKTIRVADYSGFIYEKMLVNEKATQSEKTAPAKRKADMKGDVFDNDNGAEASKLKFAKIDTAGHSPAELIERNIQAIRAKEIDGFLLIPSTIQKDRKLFYYSGNISDFDTNKYIQAVVRTVVSRQILIAKQINPEIVDEATRDIEFETIKVKKEGTSKSSAGIEYMMSLFMLAILFSILMGYGQLIMRGVLEEKSSRIIEVLISSTDTQHIFYGKIIGIGLAGLTQVAIWFLFALAMMGKFSLGLSSGIMNFLTLEIGIYFVIFFLLGFFMYAILFSIVGAAVNTDQEAQQFAAPISYLLIIPFVMGIMVTQSPNSSVALISSFIPLFTPTLMFMRITVSPPPLAQILSAISLSLLFIAFLAWLGAKIFRVGILMYGKKPSLGEILRWLRYK
ncbi:MAG: ABC transporter permease [Candidatus Aminicenantes bacterium]|nr:ABC transporter permease [Candidatus Aminicenantes bacterium]